MLYYMAFVFAGKGIADLQEAGIVKTTVLEWAPRIPVFGIYPTLQSLSLQFLLIVLLLVAIVWLQRHRLVGGEGRRRPSFPWRPIAPRPRRIPPSPPPGPAHSRSAAALPTGPRSCT